MKIEINDPYGSSLLLILNADGSDAVENTDYSVWSGEYHKNGKWSYSEGGVMIRDGWVLVNQRSTHFSSDMSKYLSKVVDNLVTRTRLWGRLSEEPVRPTQKNGIPQAIHDRCIACCLAHCKDGGESILAQWAGAEKFS